MRVQLHDWTAPNISEIDSIQTDEIKSKQNQPHFCSTLLLSVKKRTAVGIIQVGTIFNEQQ